MLIKINCSQLKNTSKRGVMKMSGQMDVDSVDGRRRQVENVRMVDADQLNSSVVDVDQ